MTETTIAPSPADLDARAEAVRDRIVARLRSQFGCVPEEASPDQIYAAVGLTVRDQIMDRWIDGRARSQKAGMKCLVYLSAEYLIGRALTNNLINLGIYEDYVAALARMGLSLDAIEEREADAGLGNGGLGRLAACFLDSLSTLDLPAMGYGIRYEYGFFRQNIVAGEQVELADDWSADGDIWEVERSDRTFEVRFGGSVKEQWSEDGRLTVSYEGCQTVLAVPYDMPIMGFDTAIPATLRLWSARAPHRFDLARFNEGEHQAAVAERDLAESISSVLYPENSHEQGQELRLKQFYFLVSATMQSVVASHRKRHGDLRTLPQRIAVQINDTHPALAIPELIRILIDDEGFSWEEAVDVAERTFNYTNHTIMPEALECWPAAMLQRLLPRIYRIIETIDARFRDRIWNAHPGDVRLLQRMAIIDGGRVRMANLCVLGSGNVNGVSQLHGRILKSSVFHDFYAQYPAKFSGITNGVTQRRWLAASNPGLAALIQKTIGDGFMRDWTHLEKLAPFADDPTFRYDFGKVKEANKLRFADWMRRTRGIDVDPTSVIDAQAKRLHEYKRQLLKVLHILYLYDAIVDGRIDPADLPKTTFIFAAKAAPGYQRAKDIIKLINAVRRLIERDARTADRIPIVFLPNYDVSAAQRLIPATDVSEQISTAGREASGTGNMKFMLNGAVTLGTMDGANVEMHERLGDENIFIFGARVEELDQVAREGTYSPRDLLATRPHLARTLEHLIDGSLPTRDDGRFDDIYRSLVPADGRGGDPYYVLYDFDAYAERCADVDRAWRDRDGWLRRGVMNTAMAGWFSSDRTIAEYNERIWHLTPLPRPEHE